MSHVMQYQPQWIREDFVDFIAEKINPVWAWKKVKASIVDVHMLSSDFYQIELQPNHNFRADAFRAGQSILVTVVIAGVREQRSYSIQNCRKWSCRDCSETSGQSVQCFNPFDGRQRGGNLSGSR